MIGFLLRGCNVNTADGEGLCSLHYACEFNQTESIKALAQYVKKDLLINAKCKVGWTPLYTAIHHNSEDAVALLLELNADVNVATNLGKTPLHCAAGRERLALCDLMLEKGAIMGAQDKYGMTALHEAAFRGNQEIYDKLSTYASQEDMEIRDAMGNTAAGYLIKCTKMDHVPNNRDNIKLAEKKDGEQHNEVAKFTSSK